MCSSSELWYLASATSGWEESCVLWIRVTKNTLHAHIRIHAHTPTDEKHGILNGSTNAGAKRHLVHRNHNTCNSQITQPRPTPCGCALLPFLSVTSRHASTRLNVHAHARTRTRIPRRVLRRIKTRNILGARGRGLCHNARSGKSLTSA
jgi:hypothetical protein